MVRMKRMCMRSDDKMLFHLHAFAGLRSQLVRAGSNSIRQHCYTSLKQRPLWKLICAPSRRSQIRVVNQVIVPSNLSYSASTVTSNPCLDGGFSGPNRPVIAFRNITATETKNAETVLESPGEGAKDELLATHSILLMASLDAPMPGYKHLRPRNVLGLVTSHINQSIIN